MQKRVTLVDIAKAVGCSVNSVSRALMDAPDISEKTKKIVRETAEELGYIPNMTAASLKKGNSKIIGILYDDLLNPYYNTVIYYLEMILSEKNYTIINYRSQFFDVNVYNNIVSRNLDGLITFLTPNEDVEKKINIQKFPIVLVGRKSDKISSVCADNIKIGQLAAQAIIDAGCKNPIYIGETEHILISRERATGFSLELDKHNIEHKLYFSEEREKFQELLTNVINNKVDSIFCFSDFIAFKVIKFLFKNNLTDIVVVGVDNIQNEIPFPVSFKSIGQSKEKIANKVIELLFKQISGISIEPQCVIEDVYLVKEF